MECLLKKVKQVRLCSKKITIMCKEGDLDIQDVIGHAHCIGNEYEDNSKNVKCKSVIVHFTTFCHQSRFYCAKKKFKKEVKSRLNLT